MNEQRIPGVRDAELPPVTERVYAIHVVIIVVLFAVLLFIALYLPGHHVVDVISGG
ncbi:MULTISPECIES: hypothetical protein [unclassified Nocardioides]|uniref:hypothetical protein n=1 Tax=unclassified Nocardioides TaxID=2615069 RepID=UPI0009F04580|nr:MULTISPECIES: hypothetical protein [unclassified Nocardioides]GAW48286.1 uncharacterized protein PD653B2_0599 [Nocardioides sp. PD653-B2]GAW52934.1 uncharacterized protein PD653_0328 [Nocardioides sp. PD653]